MHKYLCANKFCAEQILVGFHPVMSSAMGAVVVLNLRLYLTFVILPEQQSSSHCHDVSCLYYIRGELHKVTLLYPSVS